MAKNSKPRKRENGSGSVYKRKDRIYRPWVARATVNGKKVTIGTYETYKEARLALDNFMENPTELISMTFAEVFEMWKKTAYESLSKSSKDGYDACYKKVEPLHNIKFREIKTPVMQRVIDEYRDMSSSTLTKIKVLLTQLFDYAMQNDIVSKNYAQFIVLPKFEIVEKEVFTDFEVRKIEEAAGVVPFADTILMMIYTGFRISEFLELTRFNYDAENKCIRAGKKTAAGKNRPVPVHPKIQPFLDKWLSKEGETIICKDDGTPYAVDYFRRKLYYNALKKIGVRELTPHATRHTFATMLSKKNVRAENIQKLIGHSNYEVTAGTYIHQDIDTLRTAIEKIG